jgi:ribose 5-phosphate isomerase B
MKIGIGADHRGFELKEFFKAHSSVNNIPLEWIDVGAFSSERSDYPIFAREVALLLQARKVDAGILMCRTGIGMAVTANRFKGVYAAVVWNSAMACMGRQDDNVNVLVFPADYVVFQEALLIFKSWLGCTFKHNRYEERLKLIDK